MMIRLATRDEINLLAGWQLAMALETEGIALDEAVVREGVRGVFERPERGQYYIAVVDGRKAGCMLVQTEWSDWRNKAVLWIHSVYIEKEYRRQGIFRSFYQYLQQMVKEDTRYAGLRLYVEKQNETARRTYEKLGMTNRHYDLYEWMKE